MLTALVWIVLLGVLTPGLLTLPVALPGTAGRRVHATGQEIEVGFRPHVPLGVAIASVVLGGGLASVALATSGAGSVLCWLLALVLLAVLVGAVGTLVRRPRVLLTAEGLAYRGWGADASVGWEDVEGTAIDRSHGLRPLAEVLVRPGAASFGHRRAVLALPEPMGPRPAIRIPAHGLDRPWLLLEYVDQMARLPARERPARLGAEALAFLEGGLLRD